MTDTQFPFQNRDLPLENRINDLIDRLSLEEKAGQLSHQSPAIERLGIPYYNWWSEVLHGHARSGRATVFPQSIGLGATFDEDLIRRVASAIGDETRAKHHAAVRLGNRCQYLGLSAMSPTLNLFRDPRWGRGQEGYGEDPHLTSVLGRAFVQGLQGDDPHYLKVAAYAKHFAVHSGPEDGRYSFDARVSKKDLYETYLAAFKAAVDAGVEGIMGAYNAVNGEPCCASKTLLTTILREKWGFEGNVISDGGGIHFLSAGHQVTDSPEQSTAMALNNGCDLNLGGVFRQGLVKAIETGLLDEAVVDRALRRVLLTKFRLGLLDPEECVPYASISEDIVACEAHRRLAHEAAVKSIVLLKNKNDALPMARDAKSIYLCGPNAASVDALLGSYYGQGARMTTVLEGVTAAVSPGTCLTYARLCPVTGGKLQKTGDLVDGKPYQYTVAAMGMSGLYEGESGGDPEDSPHDGDRVDLELPGHQLELLKQLRKKCEKLVVVLFGAGALNLDWVMANADAVLYAFYPGQAGGDAIADILFGAAMPSGRVPYSFVQSTAELPPFDDYSMQNRTYRYIESEPQIPFGFGLSYTTFRYDSIELDSAELGTEESITMKVRVSNTGDLAGDEVIQLYVTHHDAPVRMPRFSLKAIRRVHIEPGATAELSIPLDADALSIVDDDGRLVLEPGRVTLTAGGCSPFESATRLGAPEPLHTDLRIR